MMYKVLLILFVVSSLLADHHPKGLLCKWCERAQTSIVEKLKTHGPSITSWVIKACQLGLSSDVCNYFIKAYSNDLFVYKPDFILSTNYICSQYFDVCDKTYVEYNYDQFKFDFLRKYPKPANIPKLKGEPFNMVVINDIHIQSDYAYKANADCGEPGGCCSNYHKAPTPRQTKAGYWGTPRKNCDIPATLFDNTLRYIKDNVKDIDFFVVLGDNYGHNYFRTTAEDLVDVNRYVYESIKGNFTDTTILPVLGNHECHPVDNLDLADPDNFVYKNLYPLFEPLIGNKPIEQLKQKGYYSLSYPKYNLKVLHINTQLKDAFNPKLMVNGTNPLGFFDHIGDEFYASEKKGERILILTHIPIGDINSIDEFNKNLKLVIERFSESIIGVLSAHTHNDSFIFVKGESGDITTINYVSPSLTTFGAGSPAFRVYNVADGIIDDYSQYVFDIDKHNELADQNDYSFSFDITYTMRKGYELDTWGSPADYAILHDKIHDDHRYKDFYTSNFAARARQALTDVVPSAAILCTTIDNGPDIIKCQKDAIGMNSGLFVQLLFRRLFVDPWMTPVDTGRPLIA